VTPLLGHYYGALRYVVTVRCSRLPELSV